MACSTKSPSKRMPGNEPLKQNIHNDCNNGQFSLLLMPSVDLFEDVGNEATIHDLKEGVIKAIHRREEMLLHLQGMRCMHICGKDYGQDNNGRKGEESSEIHIETSLRELHEASLDVVESIMTLDHAEQFLSEQNCDYGMNATHERLYSGLREGSGGIAFLWNGENYLTKMLEDSRVLSQTHLMNHVLDRKRWLHRNPFLVPLDVDEISKFGENFDAKHQSKSLYHTNALQHTFEKIPWKVDINRVMHASNRILLEERRLPLEEKDIIHVSRFDGGRNTDVVELYIPRPPEFNLAALQDVIYSPHLPYNHALVICCIKLLLDPTIHESLTKLTIRGERISKESVYTIAREPFEELIGLLDDLAENGGNIMFIAKDLLISIQSIILDRLLKSDTTNKDPNEAIAKLETWLLDLVTRKLVSTRTQPKKSESSCFTSRDDPMLHEYEMDMSPIDEIKQIGDFQNKAIGCKEKQPIKQDEMEMSSKEDETERAIVVGQEDDLVPIPTWCAVRTSEGSYSLEVTERFAPHIEVGDKIRIGHPYFSHTYTVSSYVQRTVNSDNISRVRSNRTNTNNNIYTIEESYDHSPILDKELAKGADTISHLYGSNCDEKQLKEGSSVENRLIPWKSTVILEPYSRLTYDKLTTHCMEDRVPLAFAQLRVWKLVPRIEDKRLDWRRDYDNGFVPLKEMYSNDLIFGEYLGVRWNLSDIQWNCLDPISDPQSFVHQNRLKYFEKVSLNEIILETYETICKHWHPIGSSIDIFKWAKLARGMKFLSKVKNSNHEVDMAFFRHSSKRKLTLDQFRCVLMDMASVKYSSTRYDTREALSMMLWSTVAMLPQVNMMMWEKANGMAMEAELARFCGQTKISAHVRMKKHRKAFIIMRLAAICIQKNARAVLECKRREIKLLMMYYDRIYRLRWQSAVICQKYWRRHVPQFLFYEHLAEKKRLIKEVHSRLWQELRDKCCEQRAAIVFRADLKLQTTKTITTMTLQDLGQHDEDTVLKLRVYVARTVQVFEFLLNTFDIKHCLEEVLIHSGPLLLREMIQPHNLLQISKRLIVRMLEKEQLVIEIFTKSRIEEGLLIANRTDKIQGTRYIITMYRSLLNIVIWLHDPSTSLQIRRSIPINILKEWILATERLDQIPEVKFCELVQSHAKAMLTQTEVVPDDEMEGAADLPLLLDQRNESDLITWLIKRSQVRTDEEDGKSNIAFDYEIKAERAERIALKFQSLWRALCARKKARAEVHVQYEKHFDRALRSYLYIHKRRGSQQRKKPSLLRADEDIVDPPDEWRPAEYYDHDSGSTRIYYFNPRTGQSSWLTEQEAACLVQRRFRSRQTQELLSSNLTFHQMVKAMIFANDVEVKYEQKPNKLSNKVNYALLNHLLRLERNTARSLYKDAISNSPCHPVIARAYGIFMLANCEPPVLQTFEKACRLFKEAHAADPDGKMFESAKDNFFYRSIVMHPDDPFALLNYALLHQCILGEYYRAEKIYRRALGKDPTNTNITGNFNLFIEQRYPGGYYSGSGVPAIILRRSEVKESRPEWGEWQIMIDPLCSNTSFDTFWYNFVDKSSIFTEPDWNIAWEKRVARSECMSSSTKNLWVEYYDSALGVEFVYNRTTEEFVWKDNTKEKDSKSIRRSIHGALALSESA